MKQLMFWITMITLLSGRESIPAICNTYDSKMCEVKSHQIRERKDMHLQAYCESGDLESCRQKAITYIVQDTPKTDYHEAIDMLEGLCDKGHIKSCLSLGRLYSLEFQTIFRDSKGFSINKKDKKLSKKYFAIACRHDASTCGLLSQFYEGEESIVLKKKACENNKNGAGCYHLGKEYV